MWSFFAQDASGKAAIEKTDEEKTSDYFYARFLEANREEGGPATWCTAFSMKARTLFPPKDSNLENTVEENKKKEGTVEDELSEAFCGLHRRLFHTIHLATGALHMSRKWMNWCKQECNTEEGAIVRAVSRYRHTVREFNHLEALLRKVSAIYDEVLQKKTEPESVGDLET